MQQLENKDAIKKYTDNIESCINVYYGNAPFHGKKGSQEFNKYIRKNEAKIKKILYPDAKSFTVWDKIKHVKDLRSKSGV